MTTEINVVDGTASYDFPSDFKTIDARDCGLYLMDNGRKEREYPLTSFGSSSEGYYITGTQIVFTPVPEEDKTVTMRYIPKIDLITQSSTTLILPEGYEDLVVEELWVKYDKREEDSAGMIVISQQFADDFRNRLIENFRPKRKRTVGVSFNAFNTRRHVL